MKIGIIDTETTGFSKSGALMQSGQARVCEIACLIANENGDPINQFCSLIKPSDGFVMSEGAQAVHGISTEQCEAFGLNQYLVMTTITAMLRDCDILIAHNMKFDWQMLLIEYAYAGMSDSAPSARRYCTMEASTQLCQLPHARGGSGYKWPKLSEALPILCGKELIGAHGALADTRGCMDLFFELKKRGIANV